MITFADLTEPAAAGAERCVDRQLWLACAGGVCTVPPVGASVFYFPQGHAEHALGLAGAANLSAARVPALVPCRVAAVRYMADPDTDEVFARIRLVPLRAGDADAGPEDDAAAAAADEQEKRASFAKTLTQSDANNGGGFSVPRYCAETIFPRLDYAADPPVQNVVAKDVHGAAWKFRHIYRGTPRRHLLTTGWSTFVNQKKLVAGDSIVFLRGDVGDLHVGIRRAKRGFYGAGGGGGKEVPMTGWDQYAGLMRGNVSPCGAARAQGKVWHEDVAEAARLAAAGQPFEVVYYPRASTPEFCVRAAAVRAAMRVQWSPGMRFKMVFETEDSSRISWFMGTVAGVQVADPIRWPQSPWRLLQVTWDEPDLLQNVKRVSPWLIELVSSMPAIHLASFSPPRKKPRIPAYPEFFPFEGQLLNPAFPPSPLAHGHHDHHYLHTYPSFFPFPDGSAPAAIQGARHAQFVPSLSDLHLTHLQSSLLYPGLRRPDHVGPKTPIPPRINTDLTIGGAPARDDVSCALSISATKKPDAVKPAGLVLFGQTILTEQQMSLSSSGCATSPEATGNSSLNWNAEKGANVSEGSGSGVIQNSPTNKASSERLQWFRDSSQITELSLEPGQCKVFIESDTVGRNLDLSALSSFDELYGRLSEMFCIESAELRSRVLYRGATGEVKHAGDEPFSDFVKSARRFTILTDAGSDNLGS
ncbi:auxin response factor 8-like [Phragmites australis]|uniref:auxin response factor 8-like n=1 Tax=Phragmites australis TaxID=29695 RepID=UPI002D798EB4|nr:auxin response factor 8-like [Phragmites australis]